MSKVEEKIKFVSQGTTASSACVSVVENKATAVFMGLGYVAVFTSFKKISYISSPNLFNLANKLN